MIKLNETTAETLLNSLQGIYNFDWFRDSVKVHFYMNNKTIESYVCSNYTMNNMGAYLLSKTIKAFEYKANPCDKYTEIDITIILNN